VYGSLVAKAVSNDIDLYLGEIHMMISQCTKDDMIHTPLRGVRERESSNIQAETAVKVVS
jgi:hypothetical protein